VIAKGKIEYTILWQFLFCQRIHDIIDEFVSASGQVSLPVSSLKS